VVLGKPAKDGSWGEGRLDDDIYFWGNWGDSGNSLYVHTGCRIGHVEEMVSEFDENGKPPLPERVAQGTGTRSSRSSTRARGGWAGLRPAGRKSLTRTAGL
jgi:hypothetical protein